MKLGETVGDITTLGDAARRFELRRGGRVVSSSELFNILQPLLGVPDPCVRMELVLEIDQPARILAQFNVSIHDGMTLPSMTRAFRLIAEEEPDR